VDEVLSQGVRITRVRRLCGQELHQGTADYPHCCHGGAVVKDYKRAADVTKTSVQKMPAKQK
jgi:hypothetical protein